MNGLNIEDLRVLCRENKIKWSLHALKRIRERKISPESVVNAIIFGEIIEQYEDDKYFPSCLIFNNDYNAPIHTVASTDTSNVHIITAYRPALNEWENDFKTRKENK